MGSHEAAAVCFAAVLMFCSSFCFFAGTTAAAAAIVGVNYGMQGDNLPPPATVVSLYKSRNITALRLFAPDAAALAALRGTGIAVVLGTLNEDLPRLAADPSFAAAWVAANVEPYSPAVTFRYINAGNEVIPGDLAGSVLQAMSNLDAALAAAGVPVHVTTVVSTSVLGASFPPSAGAFSSEAAPFMAPIVAFLKSKGSPLLANVYPYFAYSGDPSSVSLPYALLSGGDTVITDNGLLYANMFDAVVDAVYAAMDRVGAGGGVEVVVSETGWPSGGGGAAATVENAREYNNNVVVTARKGTPRQGPKPVETYLFALFNEDRKPSGVEQNFGLYRPDMTPVYHVDFSS